MNLIQDVLLALTGWGLKTVNVVKQQVLINACMLGKFGDFEFSMSQEKSLQWSWLWVVKTLKTNVFVELAPMQANPADFTFCTLIVGSSHQSGIEQQGLAMLLAILVKHIDAIISKPIFCNLFNHCRY